MERRPYQNEVLREFIESELRFWALLWERQAGKSTTFADMALYEMIRNANRTVIYGSASLLLSQEITLKTAIRTNQTAQEMLEGDSILLQNFAAKAEADVGKNLEFKTVDAKTEKEFSRKGAKPLSSADFTQIFSEGRLEFRVYHDRTSYSRTKVIAPNIATARSWSGTVLLDEIAFIRNLRELITALLPVISTNRAFKLILSTTPPEFDDTHYSFELLAPPSGLEFKPNGAGNWYESESGIRVHRADAFDTNLGGKKIYDLKTGREIMPAEAFERAPNKDGHRIAHWLWWMLGGSAACDLLKLKVAQERGANVCQNFQIGDDRDMVMALNWLAEAAQQHRPTRIGLGFDVATTTKGTSNPSVVSVVEENGPEWIVRARFIWKTKDPAIANERLDGIVDTLIRAGCRPRALAQDATNEKYYAEDNRKRLRSRVPVILVVASEGVDRPDKKGRIGNAGLDKPTNWKEYLGDQLVSKLDDNNLTLPGDAYTRMDYRLVMKDRGKFVCEPNNEGMHGDCFDADKLAGHVLAGGSSRTIVPSFEVLAAAEVISINNVPVTPKWPPDSCEPPELLSDSASSL